MTTSSPRPKLREAEVDAWCAFRAAVVAASWNFPAVAAVVSWWRFPVAAGVVSSGFLEAVESSRLLAAAEADEAVTCRREA